MTGRGSRVQTKTFLVTGGAGFIGSALVCYLIRHTPHHVINLDKLTYAGNLQSLAAVAGSERYHFVKADICDAAALNTLLDRYQPDIVVHLAAESHVDRSVTGPAEFIQTNIVGTYTLLQATLQYWTALAPQKKTGFRLLHVSTDEVYGDLGETSPKFTEMTPYAPSSPYSASKASADHLVRAWHRTFGLPVLVTHCSNNYGPCQFPEKLIPLCIVNALAGKSLPIYGDGGQIRDWLYVEDHARALLLVALQGKVGETYNIGGDAEYQNLEVVQRLCALLEEFAPDKPAGVLAYRDLITYVQDRPGHDRRYAIDSCKIRRELGWVAMENFDSGLRSTVLWFLQNRCWWQSILAGHYQQHKPAVLLKGSVE